MSFRNLLIDADILIYQTTSAAETEVDWGDDLWTLHSDAAACKTLLVSRVEELLDTTSSDEPKMCYSDSENFRKSVLPSYKGNRKGTRKPLAYKEVAHFAKERWKSFTRPTLEGDDLLGILATSKVLSGSKLIWSIDKDVMQVPGVHWQMDEPIEVSAFQGARLHMLQTLTGDPTDNYKGCPGIGKVKAERILENDQHENLWLAVLEAYEGAGLTYEDALVQARVARICRAEDYDFKKKEVRLWNP